MTDQSDLTALRLRAYGGDHFPDAGKMVGEQPTVSKTESVERERRLEDLLTHMTDAYELAYGEDCPLVKQSRAALAEREE